MKIKKSHLQGILQYLCDINEFGFEDDNIDSIDVWADKIEDIFYKFQSSKSDVLYSEEYIEKTIKETLKNGIPLTDGDDITERILTNLKFGFKLKI